jgi:hypothetical protein
MDKLTYEATLLQMISELGAFHALTAEQIAPNIKLEQMVNMSSQVSLAMDEIYKLKAFSTYLPE